MRQWRYNSTIHVIVSGQLHSPVPSPPGMAAKIICCKYSRSNSIFINNSCRKPSNIIVYNTLYYNIIYIMLYYIIYRVYIYNIIIVEHEVWHHVFCFSFITSYSKYLTWNSCSLLTNLNLSLCSLPMAPEST
jgi:hypothetical protein